METDRDKETQINRGEEIRETERQTDRETENILGTQIS